MGGHVEVNETVSAGEAVGDIRVQSADLHPIALTAEQIPAIIDELPLVALLAAKLMASPRFTVPKNCASKKRIALPALNENWENSAPMSKPYLMVL